MAINMIEETLMTPLEFQEFMHQNLGEKWLRAIGRLEQGSLVPKWIGFTKSDRDFYVIDDAQTHRRVEKTPGQRLPGIPYEGIFYALGGTEEELEAAVWKGAEQFPIPFSKVLESGHGVCTEKAILGQLWSQQFHDSFFYSGLLQTPQGGFGAHAFNIVFPCGIACVADFANPASRKPFEPFVAEIKGLKMIPNQGAELILPESQSCGRKYFLW